MFFQACFLFTLPLFSLGASSLVGKMEAASFFNSTLGNNNVLSESDLFGEAHFFVEIPVSIALVFDQQRN
jgi:hypothetical protein